MPDETKEVLDYLKWILEQVEKDEAELESVKINYKRNGIRKMGEWNKTK